MKILIAAASLMALTPAASQAQDVEERREERIIVLGGPGHRMEFPEGGLTREAFDARHAEMFARMDADGNGVVTREEIDAMHAARASAGHFEWSGEDGERRVIVRRHGDGGEPIVLGGEGGEREIVLLRRGDGEGGAMAMHHGDGERHVMVFRHEAEGGLDADGDGRWTFEEMVAPMREHFNQLDANRDGFVDESERRH